MKYSFLVAARELAPVSMSWSLSVDREQANDLHVSSVFAQSLLSSRRPSWTPSLSFRNVPAEGVSTVALPHESQPSSPEDGGNFRRSLQIDNKGLVGDAVGNVGEAASLIILDFPGSKGDVSSMV